MSRSEPTIVVGYVDTDEGRDAVTLARALATTMDRRILVAGVEAVDPATYIYESVVDGYKELVRERLEPVLRGLREDGIPADGAPLVARSPAHGLQDLVEREQPDLLVLGSSHRGRLGRALTGTVGLRLLHGSPCPVAIAPKGLAESADVPLSRIGVGFDGSEEASAGLRLAGSIARSAHAAIEVISVAQPPGPVYGAAPFAYSATDLEEAARDRAQLDLDRALAALPSDTAATGRVVIGDPARVLEEAGERLDLLVVGSRSYGPVLRVLLGSVSGHLSTASPCPLIVAPRSATPRAEDEGGASVPDPS